MAVLTPTDSRTPAIEPVSANATRRGVSWWPTPPGYKPPGKPTRELRKFALIISIPLFLIGGLQVWRDRSSGYYLIGIVVLLAILAIGIPHALEPVERAWMKVAGWLSVVTTYVILSITFFLLITPMGWLIRIFGKSSITKKPDPTCLTYWEPVEPDGPATRPDKPY